MLPQRLQGGGVQFRRQAEALEPVDQIVREEQEMEVGLVGTKVTSRDAAQGVVPFELLDEEFDAGTVVVEAPEVERLQRQIGDQDLVVILAQLEQRELGGRFLGLGPADHHEAIGPQPMGRLIPKLGDLDPAAGTGVLEMGEFAFDRPRQAGHDHETGPPGFQPFDDLVVVKPFVGAENRQPDSRWPLCETRREQVECPTGGVGVAGAQLPMPEVLGLPLETQQGMIRGPSTLDRVVADLGLLLLAVEDEDGRIDIEDQPRGPAWPHRHQRQKPIVQPAQLRQYARCRPKQEAPHGRRIGIAVQAGQILEDAIVLKKLGRLDPSEAEDHRIQHRQDHLPNSVARVALAASELLCEGVFQSNPREEAVKEIDPTVVRQGRRPERNLHISRALCHRTERYLKSRLQCNCQMARQPHRHRAKTTRSVVLHA